MSNLEITTDQDFTKVETAEEPKFDLGAYTHVKKGLMGVVGLQLLLLIGLIVPSAYTLNSGSVATLRAVPVDPYDMFRGDYVRLTYPALSNLSLPSNVHSGDTIYVVIKSDGSYWKVVRTSASKPELLQGELFLKGDVDSTVYRLNSIHYGFEQVYVPEKTGGKIERSSDLTVSLAVDTDGNAAIKRVVNDKGLIYDVNKVLLSGM